MQNLHSLEFWELCQLAGITEAEANKHGLTRSEVISLIPLKIAA